MLNLGGKHKLMSEHTNALSRRAFIGTTAAACAATSLLFTDPIEAYAVTSAEKKAEAQAALDSLDALQYKLDVASADYYTALEEQETAENNVVEAQGRIDEATEQIGQLQEQLGTRARSMYRSGSSSFIDLLLGATTFEAFTQNWGLLNSMNENDAQMVQQTKDLRQEVEEQKVVLVEQEQVAKEKAQEAARVQAEAESLVEEQQNLVDSLNAEVQQLMQQEEEARQAAEAAAAAARAAAANNGGGGGNNGGGSSSNKGGAGINNSAVQAVTGNVVVDRAYSKLGYPYVWGAGGPNSFDCSGFVSYCLTGSYGRVLGTTYTMANWPQVTDPRPGDITWRWEHVGIYIGGGQMIHASTSRTGVILASVPGNMIYRRYCG